MPLELRLYEPDQGLLLPPSLRDWLPEGQLAFFISDAIDAMDLSAFEARYGGIAQPESRPPSATRDGFPRVLALKPVENPDSSFNPANAARSCFCRADS